jgi:hypothetical protein
MKTMAAASIPPLFYTVSTLGNFLEIALSSWISWH